MPVASPFEPPPLLPTVATLELLLAQLDTPVIFCVLPSLKVPVAVNRWLVPGAMVVLFGATEMDVMVAAVTLRLVLALCEPKVTLIVVGPTLLETAIPLPGPIVATAVFDEVQVTPFVIVTSSVLPSFKVAVAIICRFVPIAI